MGYKLNELIQHGDSRGQLIAIEHPSSIPFEIKRIYYIFDTKENVRRGFHAHKSLKQLLICVNGECKIHLDDGINTKEILLNKPNLALYLDGNVWREMYDFTNGTVLLVLASEKYNESDYIRDYNCFLKYIKKGKL